MRAGILPALALTCAALLAGCATVYNLPGNVPLGEVRTAVRAEKLGEVAVGFDRVHNIQRAVEVGSVDAVISANELRPRLIEAIISGLPGVGPLA